VAASSSPRRRSTNDRSILRILTGNWRWPGDPLAAQAPDEEPEPHKGDSANDDALKREAALRRKPPPVHTELFDQRREFLTRTAAMSPACGLGPLLGEQPPGELADLGHGTVPGLGGGQPAAGPVPRRHHRDEGQVDRRPRAAVRAAPGRPGAGSRPTGGCGRGASPRSPSQPWSWATCWRPRPGPRPDIAEQVTPSA
jgi:hypothetical protein